MLKMNCPLITDKISLDLSSFFMSLEVLNTVYSATSKTVLTLRKGISPAIIKLSQTYSFAVNSLSPKLLPEKSV